MQKITQDSNPGYIPVTESRTILQHFKEKFENEDKLDEIKL